MTEQERTRDEIIGGNVAQLRGDMTQQSLADAMRDRGFDWAQATVWSVEKGKRPLRLAEAEALATVLRVQVGDLLQVPAWTAFRDLLFASIEAETRLHEAAMSLDRSLGQLAGIADAMIESGTPLEDIKRELITLGPLNFSMTPAQYLAWRYPVERQGEGGGRFTSEYFRGSDG